MKLGANAFRSTHLKIAIKVQDQPAELSLCLGHTDSYAGVSQLTLTCLHLTTSGQEKYDFLTHSNNIQVETLKLRKDGLFVYKGRAK